MSYADKRPFLQAQDGQEMQTAESTPTSGGWRNIFDFQINFDVKTNLNRVKIHHFSNFNFSFKFMQK